MFGAGHRWLRLASMGGEVAEYLCLWDVCYTVGVHCSCAVVGGLPSSRTVGCGVHLLLG
jgi:hypothetical protein